MSEESLFHQALAKPAGERSAFLDNACAGRSELRAAVDALLAAHDASGGVLDRDVAPLVPTVDSGASDETGAFTPTPEPESPTITADRRGNLGTGSLITGRYTLVEKIGEGGMGEVWVAKQTEPVKRKVALKLIKPGMDSRAVLQRFEQERQALALMDHPNIAKVLDAGMTPTGQPFFVMELVNGMPLTKFCDEMKLTPRDRLELFVPICQAVQHAHQKGIVHRDLKPANILVTIVDGKPVPKVIDFGVAKATAGKLTDESLSTQFGAIVGTLEYMSPEQAGFSSEDIDTRADIYSLGVILYELLTGLRPIDAKRLKKAAISEMIRLIREEEPSKPSTRLSTDESLPSLAALRQTEPRRLMTMLRGELDWVVMKCLEKLRDRRYETANALSRDVQRYLADEPVEARPPSVGYRLRKFLVRNRLLVASSAIVLITLVLGAGVATWQAIVATRAEKRAKNDRDAARSAQLAETIARKQADEARTQAEQSLDESQRKTARMTYERAQSLCEQGEADLGLLWMARSLELTPEGATEIDRAIRTSINLWARQVNTYEPRQAAIFEWAQRQEIVDLSISPDGQSVLVLGWRNNEPMKGPRLHDLETGKLRVELQLEEGASPIAIPQVCRAVYSPNGRYVAACWGDTKARVWNATTGQLLKMGTLHDSPVLGVSFDPTAAILASASGSTITFTTVDTGEPNGAPLRLEHDVNGVEISRDGRMVVVSSRDRVTVWDMAARKLVHTLEGVDFPVIGATFSPDSQYILANGEKVAQFWETATGKALGARMRWVDHSSPTWGTHRAIFRSDGRVAVTGGFPIRMWAVPTGEPLGAASLAAETYYPAFTPDGRRLMVQGRLFDLAPGLLPASQLPQTPLVGSLIVSPDSKTLAVLEHDGSQPWNRLLNLRAGNSIGEPAKISFSRGRLPLPLFSPDGGTVALLLGTNKLELRDASTGQPKSPTLSMDGVVRAAAFSSDGKMIATGDLGGVVRLWNAQSGEQIGKPMIHRYPIWRLQFSADVRMLLAAGGELGGIHGEARLWDTTTTEPLGPSLNIMGSVHDAAISPNGQSIAVAAFQLSVFDTATSQLRWRGTRYDIMQIAFSPDSQTVLARSWTLPVAGMYDVETGALIANMKHQTAIGKSELSPDGQLVLTSGDDLVARLWDASTGLPVGPPWKTRQRPPIGTFEVDGQSILLADDQNISRWRLATTIEGSREQIRLSVEVATRLRLDETNEVQPLASTRSPEMSQDNKPVPTDDPYPHAWKRLQELGGPVGYFRR